MTETHVQQVILNKINEYIFSVTCPTLSLSSGRISFSRQPVDGRYPVGTEVFVFCDWQSGYRLTGSQRRKCQASGNWDGNVAACHLSNELKISLAKRKIYENKVTSLQ